MIRTQIQLSEEQSKVLKRLAAECDESVAALIREAVEMYVESFKRGEPQLMKKRALAACGRFNSGEKDISSRHDKRLAKDFAR